MPDVHPVEMTVLGPWAPNFSATSLARLLGMSAWKRNGRAYSGSTSHSSPLLETAM